MKTILMKEYKFYEETVEKMDLQKFEMYDQNLTYFNNHTPTLKL